MSVICFDTETTGLNDDDEIIQLSIADATSGRELLNEYYRPSDALMKRGWTEAARVTGITPEKVADCGMLSDPDIHRKIQSILDSASIIVGYHVAYDVKMMQRAGFSFNGATFEDPMYSFAFYYWSQHRDEKHRSKNGRVFDPWMQKKRNGCGGYGFWVGKSLTDAAGNFGVRDFGAHDSMNDVYATIEVWKQMNIKQSEAERRGNAYGEDGLLVRDHSGKNALIGEDGKPMIDPAGNSFNYVEQYSLSQLLEIG